VIRYEAPHRPQSPTWTAGLAWWRSLDESRQLKLRRGGLRSCVRIVGYWARGGR
jgi:hypothetical protein